MDDDEDDDDDSDVENDGGDDDRSDVVEAYNATSVFQPVPVVS